MVPTRFAQPSSQRRPFLTVPPFIVETVKIARCSLLHSLWRFLGWMEAGLPSMFPLDYEGRGVPAHRDSPTFQSRSQFRCIGSGADWRECQRAFGTCGLPAEGKWQRTVSMMVILLNAILYVRR